MFKKKKFCDEFGWRLDNIDWGNFVAGPTFYQSDWRYFISFAHDENQERIVLEINRYLNKQEGKHPRKLKKELIELLSEKDIVTCMELLAERFPSGAKYFMRKIPDDLQDLTSLNSNGSENEV